MPETLLGSDAWVQKNFKSNIEKENALLMEFVLHGLAAHSLISKKVIEGKIEFKDLMGSMQNIGTQHFREVDLNEEDLIRAIISNNIYLPL